jgi:hypothetical protein
MIAAASYQHGAPNPNGSLKFSLLASLSQSHLVSSSLMKLRLRCSVILIFDRRMLQPRELLQPHCVRLMAIDGLLRTNPECNPACITNLPGLFDGRSRDSVGHNIALFKVASELVDATEMHGKRCDEDQPSD